MLIDVFRAYDPSGGTVGPEEIAEILAVRIAKDLGAYDWEGLITRWGECIRGHGAEPDLAALARLGQCLAAAGSLDKPRALSCLLGTLGPAWYGYECLYEALTRS